MPGARGGRRYGVAAVLGAVLLGGAGCFHPHGGMVMPPGSGTMPGSPGPIAVPPPGTVPAEMAKVTLPPYVIEAPDNLLIEVIQYGNFPVLDANLQPLIDQSDPEPDPKKKRFLRQRGTQRLPIQPISGPFQVRPDGSVGIGFWGSVTLAGLSLDQAADAIRQHILRSETFSRLGADQKGDQLVVIIDVLAYNSKRYYVVLDGGGNGEQVYPFPITGSETVMDAIANVNGLHAVASKRNIWVARRCPHPNQPWQILPVDWVGITQHGYTITNYQVMPGDRIYVKAQKLVTIDTALARVLTPIERLFGVTLLGSSAVNQLQGRGTGFNNTGQ